MPTMISDDPAWAAGYPPAPGFTQLPIEELLTRHRLNEADFRLYRGKPHAVWADWDYAECWGPGPIREVHPFAPFLEGTPIDETEFRELVKVIHGLH